MRDDPPGADPLPEQKQANNGEEWGDAAKRDVQALGYFTIAKSLCSELCPFRPSAGIL